MRMRPNARLSLMNNSKKKSLSSFSEELLVGETGSSQQLSLNTGTGFLPFPRAADVILTFSTFGIFSTSGILEIKEVLFETIL